MRRLISLLGIGLAVWVLYALQKTMPTYGDITSPIIIAGKSGETLKARDFEIAVEKITLAREIRLAAYGSERAYGTSGLWAVVEGKAAAHDQSITLTSATWLAANGARYDASERIANAPGFLARQRLEPGRPSRILMIFELPEYARSNGTILIAPTLFQPLDEEIRIATLLPTDAAIHPAITIARGTSLQDWKVVPQ
jgi:hypothetical protein